MALDLEPVRWGAWLLPLCLKIKVISRYTIQPHVIIKSNTFANWINSCLLHCIRCLLCLSHVEWIIFSVWTRALHHSLCVWRFSLISASGTQKELRATGLDPLIQEAPSALIIKCFIYTLLEFDCTLIVKCKVIAFPNIQTAVWEKFNKMNLALNL